MRKLLIAVILASAMAGCNKDNPAEPEMPEYSLRWSPVLRDSNTSFSDMDELYNRFARPAEWDSCYVHYQNVFTPGLQDSLKDCLFCRADSQQCDLTELTACFDAAANCLDTLETLVCLAERMIYQSEPQWAFVFQSGPRDAHGGYCHTRSLMVQISDLTVLNVHDYLPLKGVLRRSAADYDSVTVGREFIQPPIWTEFQTRYNFIVTHELKNAVIADLRAQALALGEDLDLLNDVIRAAHIEEAWPVIPCLAEHARFYGKDVWIFSVIWGTWLTGAGDLGHFQVFAVDTETNEILYFNSCL